MKLTWKPRYWLWVIVLVLAIAASVGPIMSNVEIAPYDIETADGAFEIRQYPDMVVAEIIRKGNRMDAMNEGFRPLADFIFGGNEQKQPIAMTAPVTGQSTELGDGWTVRFVMPRQYALADLPNPDNEEVNIVEIPARRVVALRFTGRTDEQTVAKHLEALKHYVAEKQLTVSGEPVFAFYNPPWTLPFLRRNEIWWDLLDTSPEEVEQPETEETPANPDVPKAD